ncbi:hypothetical protein B566_EDAN005514, partial [Ephemera danica]
MLLATLLLLAALTWGPQGGGCGNDDRLPGRVCESVDARNTAESLVHDLQDCRVVEGYVHIQLIDPGNNNDSAELEKLSFPKLREISHHLLLYRVSGLRSLAQLFPNLAVIRGASLFDQYALVAYEMFSLQDVALPKLAVIARGGVLLEKNPLLCYVNTVDWSRIVKDRTLYVISGVSWKWMGVPQSMLLATLLLLAALTWGPQGGGCGNDDRLPGRVCESVDARNTAESLVHDLQDCRVVEGYVHIQLIDPGNNNDSAELEKLSFPKLREISHHLLLYRVSGLRSLAQLFPNLAVIRGASLFDQYALVAYEMFSLQDVALPKLAVIARGGVLLEKNPLLCYVNTVDWSRIVKDRTL